MAWTNILKSNTFAEWRASHNAVGFALDALETAFGIDTAKLSGIEPSATADQTDAEIKTAYENNADTNEFSDAEQTRLAAVKPNALTVGAGNLAIIDFANASDTISSTLTANVSLTSSGRVAGRRMEVFFLASAADRTVTLNASWKSFGEAGPIVIPSGKTLILSLTSIGTTEATVSVAAVLEN